MYRHYSNGSKTIYASEKAFDVIYSKQGFFPSDEQGNKVEDAHQTIDSADQNGVGNDTDNDLNDDGKVTVKELKEKAKELQIEGYSSMNKAELIEAIEIAESQK